MHLRLATLKAVSFYLLHNVSTLNEYRKFSYVIVVCTRKHFASCQGYPNYRWDLTLSLLTSYIYSTYRTANLQTLYFIYLVKK
jgi:hypothetical protein